MDPRYAARYSELAASHWWWRTRDAMLIDEIRDLWRGKRRGRILDVGCGDGRLFPKLDEFGAVEGIEPDPSTLGTKAKSDRHIHNAPFREPLPIVGEFDLILMLDVLEHLEDPVESLSLARTLLAPEGVVLITVPALPILWTRHDQLNHHRLRYTRRELRRQLALAGMSVLQIRYEFHTLALAKLMVRLLESFDRREPIVPRVPARPINWVAGVCSRLEAVACRPIARWLPGSSLLATATLPRNRLINGPSYPSRRD